MIMILRSYKFIPNCSSARHLSRFLERSRRWKNRRVRRKKICIGDVKRQSWTTFQALPFVRFITRRGKPPCQPAWLARANVTRLIMGHPVCSIGVTSVFKAGSKHWALQDTSIYPRGHRWCRWGIKQFCWRKSQYMETLVLALLSELRWTGTG